MTNSLLSYTQKIFFILWYKFRNKCCQLTCGYSPHQLSYYEPMKKKKKRLMCLEESQKGAWVPGGKCYRLF